MNTPRFLLLAFLMLAGSLSQTLASDAAPDSAQTQLVYFGTYTGEKSQGIYLTEFQPRTGRLGGARLVAKTKNPTFLALDSKRETLYAVNEVGDFGGGNSGGVSAFKIDPKNGDLSFLNEQPSGGSGPCHLSVAQDGRCVLVANYGSGSVAVLPLEPDGRLRPPSGSIQHRGSSVNPQRQEGPHAHFITWSPDDRLVLACDLGLDQILLYRLDPTKFLLTPNDPPFFSIKAGSGPRHVAFDPSGHFAYVLNELSSTLVCCSYDAHIGRLSEIQTVSTLPENYTGANTCAEIQVHPSGKFVYASNRGHNSVAVFAVESETGKVTLIQNEPTQGKTPRHFTLDPLARWLIAENQDSDNVVVFKVDPSTGRLTPNGEMQKVGAPVCGVFFTKH